jgi:hypothetical protein
MRRRRLCIAANLVADVGVGSFATDAGGPVNPVMSALPRERRHFIGEAKRRDVPNTHVNLQNIRIKSHGLGPP